MKPKATTILPLASALGALAGTAVVTTEAQSAIPSADPAAFAASVTTATSAAKGAEHARVNRRDAPWFCYDRSARWDGRCSTRFARLPCIACVALFKPLMGVVASDVFVEFAAAAQSLGALQAAAYRLIGTATCQIDRTADRWVCKLTPVSGSKKVPQDSAGLKTHFLDLVTDENLRERIAQRTDGVRNVILSLAFGSLANSPSDHH